MFFIFWITSGFSLHVAIQTKSDFEKIYPKKNVTSTNYQETYANAHNLYVIRGVVILPSERHGKILRY